MKHASLTRRSLLTARAAIVAAGAVATVPGCSNAAPSAEIEQREVHSIIRAVFAGDRLWLLHDDGSLASLRPDEAKPERIRTSSKVLEICKSGGLLFALIGDSREQWTLQQRSPDGWALRASLPIKGDSLAAMDCNRDDAGVTVVTNRRLLEIDGKNVRSIMLKRELRPPLVNGTALVAEDAVWVGFNVGEWGGGLRRIARGDGQVETVERNTSGNLCGGPLNTSCDPINGIVTAPWNPSCIVAAVGLTHMMAHGRLVEVCGKSVRRFYFKPLNPQPPSNPLDDGEPSSTVPFFGLTRTGNTLWAIGIDGLYRFDGIKAPQFRPLPTFENRGGYWVSFDVSGTVLVMTDVNQRRSLSGSVPIMAAR